MGFLAYIYYTPVEVFFPRGVISARLIILVSISIKVTVSYPLPHRVPNVF